MKLEKPLTEEQINQIGRLLFFEFKEWNWEIYPQEKFSPESRWNGIDIVPKGQTPEDDDIYVIQINLKEDLGIDLSITFMDADGDSYRLNNYTKDKIKEILNVK